jgi:hypothetical protein
MNGSWKIRYNEEISKPLKGEDKVRFIVTENQMAGACRKNGR